MTDTTPDMEALHERMLMRLSGEERFRMGLQMADEGWQMMLAGIRARHPETEGDERAFRWAVLAHLQRFDPAGYGWVRLEDV